MRTSADPAIDYGLRVLQEGIDFSSRGFDIVRDMMEAPPHLQDDKAFWRDSFVYLSRYRPFPMAVKPRDLGFGGEVRHLRGERYSWVFTDEPLPLEAVYRFELAPHFTHNTRGHYILALARAMGAPVELVKLNPHTAKTEVAFLFRNPRGAWQLSYFEEGFGPTGHIEENPHGQGIYRVTPESMVEGAFSHGYTRFQPGTLDALAETFLPPDELRRALPGYSGDGLP